MEDNIKEELEMTLADCDMKLLEWLNSDDRADAAEELMEAKRDEILLMSNGKVSICMSADGAWQKQKIGKAGGDSTTGHNFAVGGYSKKVVSLQCYSQHCRLCETAEKNKSVAKEHRCPRNFDIAMSSKSMVC